MTPPEEEPQAGLPGGAPAEGAVVTEDEEPPAGQDEEVKDGDTGDPDPVRAPRLMCVCASVFNKRIKNVKNKFKNSKIHPGRCAWWIECQPVNQKVTSLIPSQGTCLGCQSGPQCGALERQPHIDVSLPLFPSV